MLLLTLQAVEKALTVGNRNPTVGEIARLFGVDASEIQAGDDVKAGLRVERVSRLDDDFKKAVKFEAGSGEDAITLQAIQESGELFAVRDDAGEVRGVMGLVYDNEGGVHIHRIGIVGGAYGLGVGSLLVQKAVETARSNGRRRLKLACNTKDADMISFYEKQGFQEVSVCEDYFKSFGGGGLAFLELDVSDRNPPARTPARIKLEDDVCLGADGRPLKLEGFEGYTVCILRQPESIERVNSLELMTYPRTAEGINTFTLLSNAKQMMGVKDKKGEIVAACYYFQDKSAETVYLHGVPLDTTDHTPEAVALVSSLKELTGAKKVVCNTFPATWLPVMRVMIEAGARVERVESRPITELDKPEKCPVYVWDDKPRSYRSSFDWMTSLSPYLRVYRYEWQQQQSSRKSTRGCTFKDS